MSDTSTTRVRRVAYDQIKTMIDFMGQHLEFAAGTLRSLEARHTSKKLWGELTKILNARDGARKSADGWSKYWSDYKNKLKKKLAIVNKLKRSGQPSKKLITPFSKTEKRAISILGPYFKKKKLWDFVNDVSSWKKSVKVERSEEEEDLFCKNSEASDHDRLSDRSGGGAEAEEDALAPDSTDVLMENICPKWLMEVEKKRADAELIRAKAEERRAEVAAKSAQAAVIQAEALQKLAEAAAVQSEAILRIAMHLESRGHSMLSL